MSFMQAPFTHSISFRNWLIAAPWHIADWAAKRRLRRAELDHFCTLSERDLRDIGLEWGAPGESLLREVEDRKAKLLIRSGPFPF